jgi:WD40 repeat protein/tetratricopeptide (TPR) repeat protein
VLADVRRLRDLADGASQARTAGQGDAQPTEPVNAPVSAVAHGLMTGRFATAPAIPGGSNPAPTASLEPDRTDPAPSVITPDRSARAHSPAAPAGSSGSSSFARRPEAIYFREIARLGAQVADALEYAHRQGVVHRDIKPSNLMLDAQGNVWVTDFGLAKLVEGDDLSQSHDLVGTLRFMAPERFRGITDRRGDIYALGATLYEMLALRPAFAERDHVRLIEQITHEPPRSLRQHDGRIPRDLETIVHKILSKDSKDRCDHAGELRDELRRFLDGRPTRWRRVGPLEQFRRWCKRNPWLAAANITAAVLTTILAIGSTIAAWIYRDQRTNLEIEQGNTQANLNRAVKAERTANERLAETQRAERQARLALGKSLLSEGAALQRTGLVGQRFESLDRLARAAQILGHDPDGKKLLPEIRDRAILGLGLVDLRPRVRRRYPEVVSAWLDSSLERSVVVDRKGEVIVRRLDDNHELFRLPAPKGVDFWDAGIHPSEDDGLLTATYHLQNGQTLHRVWDAARKELLASLTAARAGTWYHPSGRGLLFQAPEGGIGVWDRDQRRVIRRLPLDVLVGASRLDPTGRRLAVANDDEKSPRLVVIDMETGRVLANWTSRIGSAGLAWSADGRLLASGGAAGNPQIYVRDVEQGTVVSVLQGHTDKITNMRFAHAGYLLASTSWDGTTRLWDAVSGETLVAAPGNMQRFAPDDRGMGFLNASHEVDVSDLADGGECLMLHPGRRGNRFEGEADSRLRGVDVSPDGRLLATCEGESVRLWETARGRELARIDGFFSTALFQPDGRALVCLGKPGLFRWPIGGDPAAGPDALSVGPPQLLHEATGHEYWATWLPDRTTLAALECATGRVLLVDTARPSQPWKRTPTLDCGGLRQLRSVAVSPDGHWLAIGGWRTAGILVWDVPRRRLVRTLKHQDSSEETCAQVTFSADGGRLVGSHFAKAFESWRVETWEPEPQRLVNVERSAANTRAPAFTNDGRLMARTIAPDQVQLADAATGRELARLTTLQPITPSPVAFTPDGTKLVATTAQQTVLIWDLRRIREQLAPLGLDWDAPPFPEATTETASPIRAPRSVRVVGAVLDAPDRRASELATLNARLRAHPDDADALIGRGWLRLRTSKIPEALADLEQGLRLRPDDTDALFLLAEAYGKTKDLRAAKTALERYLVQFPDDVEARLFHGQLALKLGLKQEAAEDFRRVLEADPSRDNVRFQRAQVSLSLDRFQDALTDLDELVHRYPRDAELYELRSQAHERLGHHDRAQADLKRASESVRADPQELNNLAWQLATAAPGLRDPERALELARKAVAQAPGQAIYLNTLGVAQYRAGEYSEAIATLEKSLAAGKGETDAFDLFFLAMARFKLGQIARARADFDHAKKWRRDHPNLTQPGWSGELDAFQAEARALLGGPPPELPADVFAREPPDHP